MQKRQQAETHCFKTFIDSLKSPETKKTYSKSLSEYCQWLGVQDPNNLVTKDLLTSTEAVNKIEDTIKEFIIFMNDELKRSYSSIHIRLAAITHFYTINRVNLNRTYLSKFKPVNRKVRNNNDKAYNHKQIEKLLESSVSERDHVTILLMASSGLRIGALRFLTIGNLSKIYPPGYPPNTYIYKIVIYEKEPEEYYTFTTFETAAAIDAYLDYRTRRGEILKPESPLLRNHFDASVKASPPKIIGHRSFHNTVHRLLIRAGIKDIRPRGSKELKEVMMSHGFRKFCITQMKKAKVDFNDREALVGHKHSRGLDVNYDRTDQDERLQEFLKAIDLLTISPENRLRKQVAEQDYTIQVRMAEKDKQIEEMIRKQEQFEQLIQSLIDSGQLKPSSNQ
jgi:integrase